MNKREEYIQRGLPHIWPAKDGKPARECDCRECKEARQMGLGKPIASEYRMEMLFADPDWRNRQ